MQDMYTDNYEMLMKETKECLKKWRDIPCSLIGRLNIVDMSVSQLIYKFNTTFSHNHIRIFCRNRQANSKISMEMQRN